MSNTTFPLSLVVNVSVNVASIAAAPPTFNQGLIIGTSAIIPSVGANSRLRQYTGLTGLLADGFTTSSPEYIAAQIYFSQSPAPQYLWIGRQDLTAIQTAIPHAAAGGTNYHVGDVVTVTEGGASAGQLLVTAVTAGAVTSLSKIIGSQGTGYTVTTALATTTTGTGTGLQVDITAIGETALDAVTACRIASAAWYLCGVIGAADADHLAIAGYAQAATPQMQYVCNSSTAAIAAGTAANIALQLQALLYNRAYLQYATTQSGAFPNQIYFFAALMGTAMGLNTGLANSYFTMKFKPMAGMVTEPLSQTQLNTIEAANANLYLSYANVYSFEEQGVQPNGQFFDEVLFLDMLASTIQFNCMNVFTSQKSIPQSDGGESLLINAVTSACSTLRSIGFIAQSGTWNGVQVLNLAPGAPLPTGFSVQAAPFSTQATSDRQARKMMPIYVAFQEAGSGHSLTVGVFVQR